MRPGSRWPQPGSGGFRSGDQRRQPADLQLQPHHHQQIGLPQFEQEAGLGFHEVRILVALGDRFDVDLVPADFLRQGRQVGRRRDDIQLLGSPPIGGREQAGWPLTATASESALKKARFILMYLLEGMRAVRSQREHHLQQQFVGLIFPA